MLDIKFIRDNQDKVAKAITDKNMDLDLEELLGLDQRRRELLTELESLQATKNQVSKEIPSLDAEAKQAKILEMQEVDKKQTEVAGELKLVQERFDVLMLRVPNIPSQESPIGQVLPP
jgi:seryl-tRNA synthetase